MPPQTRVCNQRASAPDFGKICHPGVRHDGFTEETETVMPDQYEKRLLRVIDHIHAHADADLSLDALADVAAMSRFHWHRVFRAITGETVAEAVRRVRMHKATFLLCMTDLTMEAVARNVGYPTARSFARAFVEMQGMSPSAFRKRGEMIAPLTLNKTGEHTMFDITIRPEPARRLFAVEHRGPYMEIARSFEKLGAIVASRNLWPQAMGMVGVYYDDPISMKPADLRSHAALIVGEDVPLPDGLEEVRLPGGTTAVLRFRGHYSGLPAAYDYLYGVWLPESEREAADSPPFELYVNSPMDTAAEDLLTDISVPLK
jgi:AraC family transcriptional regulator